MTLAASLRTRVGPFTESRLPVLRRHAIALAFWIVIPVLALLVLGAGTDKLVRHINSAPAGIPGVMTVTFHTCRDACIAGGTFVSSDGRYTQHNLQGLWSWQTGQRHRAVYDTSTGDVIPLPGHWDATSTVVGMAGALGFLALWGGCLYASMRRRSPARA